MYKRQGEEDYRYIVATDLSWRTLDIVEAYSLRWLIEVVFEDWKANEGWNKLIEYHLQVIAKADSICSMKTKHVKTLRAIFVKPTWLLLLLGASKACWSAWALNSRSVKVPA